MKKQLKIWIACSGGIDSIVLAHFLHSAGFHIGLLHVNFHLRGDEADGDEAFVHNFAKELKIELRVKHFDTPQIVKENKGNTQIIARDLRYTWFKSILKEGNCCIALGHHLDDQIETFLIQLERGGGIRGLCVMPQSHDKFIRPLLQKDRRWILDYATQHNLKWREDSSNASTKYKRNFYRHHFVHHPNFETGKQLIIDLFKDFQQLQFVLGKTVRAISNEVEQSSFLTHDAWKGLSILEKKELLYHLNIPRNQITELNKLFEGQKGAYVVYDNLKLVCEDDGISFSSQKESTFELQQKVVDLSEVNYADGNFYIDAEAIKGTLELRKWEHGDRFSPLGLKGTKRLSKYLNDLPITAVQKQNTLVITDNENIIAVEHGAPANKVKITQNTRKVLRLTIRKI